MALCVLDILACRYRKVRRFFAHRLSLVNTRLLQLYNAADPRVRPLVVFVRTWMRSHFLLTGRGNTLTSYAASMLVVCWLQRCARPPVLPTPEQMMARHAESGGETCEVEGRECGYIVKGEPCAVPTENRQTLGEWALGTKLRLARWNASRSWGPTCPLISGVY